jgi:hypothetical protein
MAIARASKRWRSLDLWRCPFFQRQAEITGAPMSLLSCAFQAFDLMRQARQRVILRD